jgi:hypothetical protein
MATLNNAGRAHVTACLFPIQENVPVQAKKQLKVARRHKGGVINRW